jgi:hypothetical protein
MTTVYKVSHSKVKTWRRCHRAYYYKYIKKLRKKTVSRPLVFGRLAHEMMEEQAAGRDPFVKIVEAQKLLSKLKSDELRDEMAQIIDDCELIMTEYFEYYKKSGLKRIEINGKLAEHHFEIEIMPGVIWQGYLDGLGNHKAQLWLIEHKTGKKPFDRDNQWRNLQSLTYFRACQMMGWGDPDGVMWDFILNRTPPVPQILKDGSPSQRAIKTLPLVLKDWCRANGYRVKDFPKLMRCAKEAQDEWFTRVFTPAKDYVINQTFDDFLETTQEMLDYGEKSKAMNIDKHCSWCDFEKLCRAELTLGDVEYLIERDYETNGKKHNG